MDIIRSDDRPAHQGSTFSGVATLANMLSAEQTGGISLTVVDFADGALTHWHEHPGIQILYILSGVGRVGTATDQWQVAPGDVVLIGPGERHWHGAAEGHDMSHISITTVGPPIWYEPVTFDS